MNITQKISLLIGMLVCCSWAYGQDHTTVRKLLRKGNKHYKDSLYNDAETAYKKAINLSPANTDAFYNLGTTLMFKEGGDAKQALEELEKAGKMEKDKQKLGDIYRNIGVLLQSQKQLKECIEAYKVSLRNDPTDNEARYNLALAQKQLQEQENQQQNQQDQQKKQEQNQQKEPEQQKEQNKQQQEQQEPKISKEAAEQMLRAITQEEKNVQDKVKKSTQLRGRKKDKDW